MLATVTFCGVPVHVEVCKGHPDQVKDAPRAAASSSIRAFSEQYMARRGNSDEGWSGFDLFCIDDMSQ